MIEPRTPCWANTLVLSYNPSPSISFFNSAFPKKVSVWDRINNLCDSFLEFITLQLNKMIFNSVLSKNMNIWNDTNSACERNFKIYYMVDHTWDLWKLLSSYTSTWIHVKSEFFLCKEGLTRRETHWATAPMFFVCFPEVLWSDICKDWRFSKRKCWGCITCITNILFNPCLCFQQGFKHGRSQTV